LIVDDDRPARQMLLALMRKNRFETLEAEDGLAALHLLEEDQVDVVLLDIKLPGIGGMEVLRRAQKFDGAPPIILMTGFGTIKSAVEALKCGASNYLTKPFNIDEILLVVRETLKTGPTRREHALASTGKEDHPPLREIMGSSPHISRVIAEIELVAPTDFAALITGETGSGKEILAAAIHRGSGRARGPFVPVDCGSIIPSLMESEFFGHEKGAFTGAHEARPGKLEVASGGTLFLDEISNLQLGLQPKLLRALQEKKIWRVGGRRPIDIDIRVVAASNQTIAPMIRAGRFRADLYYRLNEYSITLPPLRERPDDILFLANLFLASTKQELNKDIRGLTEEAQERLMAYDWPGNVRELRNVMRRAVLVADTHVAPQDLSIGHVHSGAPSHQPEDSRSPAPSSKFDEKVPFKELVRDATMHAERTIIAKVLTQTNGNKAEAARVLQVDYKTLHKKVKQYSISPEAAGGH